MCLQAEVIRLTRLLLLLAQPYYPTCVDLYGSPAKNSQLKRERKVSVWILMKNNYDPTQMNLDKVESSNEVEMPLGSVISHKRGNHG